MCVFARASVKAVVERLTHSAYLTTARSLLEKDKTIYTLLLAIEVQILTNLTLLNPYAAGG